MSRDMLTVGSTMRIPLLYRGEYSQWREMFMNYLEQETDGEAMINSIKNGDHPLPVVAQVSLSGTAQNAIPTLKDPKFWTSEEKKTRNIDCLARSLLIQGLPNDIYYLIDSNETAKDLWDALERQMHGSEYGEQDRKTAILYEYETFKANEGEKLIDTYLRYLQVINDLKKCGYKKDNCELNYKFLNNLQPEWKQYGKLMRQTKNLMDINIDALYNILKQNQGDANDALGYKKKAVVVTSDPLALVAEKTKVSKRKKKVEVQTESKGNSQDNLIGSPTALDMLEPELIDHARLDSVVYLIAVLNNFTRCTFRLTYAIFVLDTLSLYMNPYGCLQDLDTFSSVRRPKQSSVIWKKKWSSNTSNVDLSSVSYSKLNKDVKRYSHKDLLSCSNSHLEETSCAYVCNDAMNVSCNSRLCDSFDENNLFIFNDKSVRISPVSKMTFRKKPRDSLNVHSKRNSNQSLPKTVHRWLHKMQPLAEPVAKWIPRIVQICLWIIDSGCSKHMTGLPKMKFKKDHLCSAFEQGKIHQKRHKSKTAFASNKPLYLFHMDLYGPIRVESINGKRYVLVVVDDYSWYTWLFFLHLKDEASDVIISFIKKTQVNLQLQVQRVRTDNGTEFKNKTLAKFFDEVGITQQFSAARTPQQNGVVERRNRTLVEAARTMLITYHRLFGLKPSQQLVSYKIVRLSTNDVGKLKAKGDIGVFIGYSKESAAFRIYNKRTRKIHKSVNVNFDEISEMDSKQFSLEPGLSNLNETGKSSNPSVSQVSETSKKDLEDLFQKIYDEYFDSSKIMKSSTTKVETFNVEVPSNEEEVFHESS
nr:hypothetical protein [Tanacetum cinerariifolium]